MSVTLPGYDRAGVTPGIFHLGPGAFFRAHTAAFTDTALETMPDWGIETAALRSAATAEALAAQDGLYTLLTREGGETRARVIGAVLAAHPASRIAVRLTDPAIRIVTLTVTEKAYGIDPATGGLDPAHPAIAADLAAPGTPHSAVGHLVRALGQRRAAGIAPFAVLCCDNLPANGPLLRRLVLAFAERLDPDLARWIETEAAFPACMVDRITPASTPQTLADAARLTGRPDLAAVEAEAFGQWVIEDRFPLGRPAWDRAGALFVQDVAPYETMKLRMLNGAHSLLAYLGLARGHAFIRDAVADPALLDAARRHLDAAAATLGPVPGVDLQDYARTLLARFANRAIAHRTLQVAMDGTQKLPQRLLAPAAETLRAGGDTASFALATAAWMRHAATANPLDDPRAAEIAARLAGVPRTGAAIAGALLALPGLFPAGLRDAPPWRAQVAGALEALLSS